MKQSRIWLAAALTLALCLCAAGASAQGTIHGHLGETLPDFSVQTIDGGTFTLSEALAGKDMVLINLWATWCGPCAMEFPYMQEAYDLYKDRVEIIALSVEANDTNEILADYVQSHGMTFPVGSDATVGLGPVFATTGIPTTLVVDRFGVVSFIGVGAQLATDNFTRLFDAYVGENYTETRLIDRLPPPLPSVNPTDEALLNEAANAEGGNLFFRNPEDPYVWPVMVEETPNGRSSLVSSNWGQDSSICAVFADVTAGEGDALAFEFFTSTEASCDLLTIAIDGEIVKRFGGEHDWTQWAVPLKEGEHEIAFSYVKDFLVNMGEDVVRIDNARIVSGEEAAALLAALPVYPTADEISLTVTDGDARQIMFDDPDGILPGYFACQSYWIVPSGTAHVRAAITPDIDPEAASFYTTFDGAQTPLLDTLTENGYVVSTTINSLETSGYVHSNVYLYPFPGIESPEQISGGVMFFMNEENVDELVAALGETGVEVSWRYAEDVASAGVYTVRFVDQNDDPVPGCIVNFCTDETCVPVVADETGVASFTGVPYAYHLQVIKVPDGYEFDTTQALYTKETSEEITFIVTKK